MESRKSEDILRICHRLWRREKRRDDQDAGRTEGRGGQDAGGQVQLLLLDDGGVHLKLDSAGKRVDEGEKRRVVARGTPAWPEQKEESLTLSLKKFF